MDFHKKKASLEGKGLFGEATGRAAPGAFLALAKGKEVPGSPAELYKMLDEAMAEGEIFKLRSTIIPHKQGDNGNFWRIKNSAYRAVCKSFTDKVFLKDHCLLQESRAGTILSSKAIGSGDTAYMEQVVEVSEPWAIKGLLRGTIDRFSIQLNAHDVVAYCSICGADVMDGWCGHVPGETYEGKGKEMVCWWEVVAGTGKETSAVVDPAVQGTYVKEIQQLAASLGGITQPSEEDVMTIEELQAALASKEAELQAAQSEMSTEKELSVSHHERAERFFADFEAEQAAHQETEERRQIACTQKEELTEQLGVLSMTFCEHIEAQVGSARLANKILFGEDLFKLEDTAAIKAETLPLLQKTLFADQILIEREARNLGADFDVVPEREKLLAQNVDALSLALETIRSTPVPQPAPPMGKGAPLDPEGDKARAGGNAPQAIQDDTSTEVDTFDVEQMGKILSGMVDVL